MLHVVSPTLTYFPTHSSLPGPRQRQRHGRGGGLYPGIPQPSQRLYRAGLRHHCVWRDYVLTGEPGCRGGLCTGFAGGLAFCQIPPPYKDEGWGDCPGRLDDTSFTIGACSYIRPPTCRSPLQARKRAVRAVAAKVLQKGDLDEAEDGQRQGLMKSHTGSGGGMTANGESG